MMYVLCIQIQASEIISPTVSGYKSVQFPSTAGVSSITWKTACWNINRGICEGNFTHCLKDFMGVLIGFQLWSSLIVFHPAQAKHLWYNTRDIIESCIFVMSLTPVDMFSVSLSHHLTSSSLRGIRLCFFSERSA